MDRDKNELSLECLTERIERLEHKFGSSALINRDESISQFALIPLMLGSTALLWFGVGNPNHYYQPIFALAAILVAYVRNGIKEKFDFQTIVLTLCDLAFVTLALKVVIGGGDPHPFFWAKFPVLSGGLTDFELSWIESPVSEFTIPLTVIQSFFVLLVFIGCLTQLDLLAALGAFVLGLIAVPQLVAFNWEVALLGLILGCVGLFLQFTKQTI